MSVPRGPDFDTFVASNSFRLLRLAVLMTADRHAADDLLQDVLERLYVAWPRVQDPLAYAKRALANGSANRWRRRSRQREVALPDDFDRPGTGPAPEQVAERDALMRALATLPPRQRAVVALRYVDDRSEAETAALLGVSTGTVKSQSARALTRLRALIPDHDRSTP